jgi:tRNA threonylcarbamoyladenosine modification (KEOPS) complex Cgi121 subunit
MSKKNVFELFTRAAGDKQLKDKLQTVANQDEFVALGQQEGLDFSSSHVEEAITELKQKQGFFKALAEAALEIFAPNHDDYPATGVQPFSGDPNPNP